MLAIFIELIGFVFVKKYRPAEIIKVPRFSEKEGFYTTESRSRTMSKIRAKNTKPELLLRKELWKRGFRYRTSDKTLPGKPDISNKSRKVAVFVDGEFWHGYNWEVKKDAIKSNRAFWIPKIERNMQRDEEINALLERSGYKILRFWDFEVKKNLEDCVKAIEQIWMK